MEGSLDCFNALDIRGRMPDQFNEDIARRIGKAFATLLNPERVMIGHDIRLSSPAIADAVTQGLLEQGVQVCHLGLVGTEEVYFATAHHGFDGGVMVTASHNPITYNGIKLVREGSRPVSHDQGLQDIKQLAERNQFEKADKPGDVTAMEHRNAYIEHLLSYVQVDKLAPLKLLVNAGNSAAGLIIDQLEPRLPFEFIKMHHEPDGNFPNGIPNPLLPENQQQTADAVRASGVDMGIAWDGDFDRCFLFDAEGNFVNGYYLVGLLSEAFLGREPGATVIHCPRLIWNTIDVARKHGGKAVCSRAGHTFMKEKMRSLDAVYGGEVSAHHFFRDFSFCDSGMIPWLIVAQLMSNTGRSLASLIDSRQKLFPASDEINWPVADADFVVEKVRDHYQDAVLSADEDGLSMEFSDWRMNLRKSNTEPLLRLNVESRGNPDLLRRRIDEVRDLVAGLADGEPDG